MSRPALQVKLHWPLLLLTLLGLPLLLGLGSWQVQRAEFKRAQMASFVEQQALAPVLLSGANIEQLPRYRRVLAQGQFDNEHTWLLDNKQRRGRVGYEVVTPFVLTDGTVVLVNRGWIPGTEQRSQLPPVAPVHGQQTLFAELAIPSSHPLLNAEAESSHWPRRVLALEVAAMAAQSGHTLASGYLRLDESSPGAFETGWQAVTMGAEKHTGYALQWFALALALAIWCVFANSNLWAWWRGRRQAGKS